MLPDLQNLLVTLCRRDFASVTRPAQLAPLADRSVWDDILALAGRHKVTGLFLAALSRSDYLTDVDGPARARHDELFRTLRRRSASIELERDHLIDVLEETAGQAIVLKGGALIGSVYRDSVERDMIDLDFLVPENRLKAVLRAFAEEGYRPPQLPNAVWQFRRHHFHIPVEKPATLRAEIHWALERRGSLTWLDPGMFFERAIVIETSDSTLRCPCPEHMILHLVLQNCHEGFARLSRLVDIDRILAVTPELAWDELTGRACEANLAGPTALSLRLAQDLLGTTLPESVVNTLRPTAVARVHISILGPLQSMLAGSQERPSMDRLFYFWLLPSARHRIRFLRSLLTPRPSFPPGTASPGRVGRWLKVIRLGLFQIYVYVRAAASSATGGGRYQMRFWSRKARSSERR
jgi:hypothetical protein